MKTFNINKTVMKKLLLSILFLSYIAGFSQTQITLSIGAKVRNGSEPISKLLLTLEEEREVLFLGNVGNYIKIKINDTICFTNTMYMKENDKNKILIEDIELKIHKEQDSLEKSDENIRIKLTAERKNEFIKKYGIQMYKKCLISEYWLGMNEIMFLESNNLNNFEFTYETSYISNLSNIKTYKKDNVHLTFSNSKLYSVTRIK